MKSSKYLIVANGNFLAKSIIKEAALGACIVALDGAAHKLALLSIKPDIIFGDFDSIYQESDISMHFGIKSTHNQESDDLLFSEPYLGNHGTTIIPARNQNFTDLQKSLKFVMQFANRYDFPLASSIHIVCATGGRMDHEQANIRVLQSEYSTKCPIYLHSDNQTMTYATNQSIIISGYHHDYCGLFGMPYATMVIKNGGLEYGGDKPFDLLPLQYSSSNRLIGSDGAVIDITGSALIVNPPMLNSQRVFSKMSRFEQLSILLQESR